MNSRPTRTGTRRTTIDPLLRDRDQRLRDVDDREDDPLDVIVFWNLTPSALHQRMAISHHRDEQEWQRTATLASWLMSAWVGKKAPSPGRLLGRIKDA